LVIFSEKHLQSFSVYVILPGIVGSPLMGITRHECLNERRDY